MAQLFYPDGLPLAAPGVHHHPRVLHETIGSDHGGPAPLIGSQLLHLFKPFFLKAFMLGSVRRHEVGHVDPQRSAVLIVMEGQGMKKTISVAKHA